MKRVFVIFLFLAMSFRAFAQERFEQERFAIGLWVDPPLDERADERYRELAEANFTLVIGGFGADRVEKAELQLELCRKYTMGAIVVSHGIEPEALPTGPALWGYILKDEPTASHFPELRKQADAIREARPGKLVFVNLYPNYAGPKQLGTPTYDEHVRQFVEVYDPAVLCMDHYPIFKPNADGRDAYCDNLAVMRKYSLEADIPFWNFFNVMPFGPHTDPTESQIAWQVYSSLAYGAKGVLYFCYYTPLSPEFPKGGAIIARDGRKTRHWYEAQRLNARLKNLGPALMRLTSTDVLRVTEDDEPATVLEGQPITNITRADVDPPHDYLIGVFRHEDGRRAVLLNNYRFAYSAWPTVSFDADAADVVEVDQRTGEEAPLHDDSPEMDGIQVSLDAGQGRLFLLPG